MILILMGVTGSGKSTVGELLGQTLGWEFRDADQFHPMANVEKMRSGVPLTDDDRWPWLAKIAEYMRARLEAGQSSIIACSALKAVYRQALLEGDPRVNFVHLKGDAELIRSRLQERRGHFMNPALLASQFATLEEPKDVFTVDIHQAPEAIAGLIRARFSI